MPSGTSCPAGSYCPSGTSATRHTCPAGYFCPANSRHPKPCPGGRYCVEGVAQPEDCGAGFYCPRLSKTPTPCTIGNYCPGSNSMQQIPCPGNTHSNAQASACSCVSPENGTSTGTAPNCTVRCNASFTLFNGQCYPSSRQSKVSYMNADGTFSITPTNYITYVCPPCYSLSGNFCTFSSTCKPTCPGGYVVNVNGKCMQCPPGKQSLNNKCVNADAGYFSSLGVEVACPAGTWSAAGATQCSLCPAGTSSSVIGATSSSSCNPCPAGTWSNAGAARCIPCISGTWSTTIGRTTACTNTCRSCPTTQYASSSCTAWQDTVCTACSQPDIYHYVSFMCGPTTDTQFSAQPTCSTNYYLQTASSGSGSYNRLGSPGTCVQCSNPVAGTTEYVTEVCGVATNTQIATKTCASHEYLPSLAQGSSTLVGSAGKCKTCTRPTRGTAQYVTAVCGLTTDTQIATQTCSTNQYADNITQGDFDTQGSQGVCRNCLNPTSGTTQYVTAICTATTNTQIATKTCASNEYVSGLVQGSNTTVGSTGQCKTCSNPTGNKYTSAVCGATTDTQFATKTCSTGQYLSDTGTYNRRGSATCSTCSTPTSTQYVSAVCTATSNTQFAAKPVCSSGQFLDGFNSGNSTTQGSSGRCKTCSNPAGSQYVSTVCGPTTDTQFAICSTGQYLSDPGTYNRLGSTTCSTCSTPTSTQYVTAVCTATSNTRFAAKPTCNQNEYLSGFVQGSSTTVGSAGQCKTCSNPAGSLYVSTVCGPTTDTQFLIKICPAGQYLSLFNPGTYNRLGSATCSTCSEPTSTQYVTKVCTNIANTQFAAKPVCSNRFLIGLVGFRSGTSRIPGSSGNCI